jgi:hypothetical protein
MVFPPWHAHQSTIKPYDMDSPTKQGENSKIVIFYDPPFILREKKVIKQINQTPRK